MFTKKQLIQFTARSVLVITIVATLGFVGRVRAVEPSPEVLAKVSQEVSALSRVVSTLVSVDSGRKEIVAHVQTRLAVLVGSVQFAASMPTATEADRAAQASVIAGLSSEVSQLSTVISALAQLAESERDVIDSISVRLGRLAIQLGAGK